jgi:hypothetical protein
MGTRSITRVLTGDIEDAKPLVAMYRQYDGYPEGHGVELANFLLSGTMVNGLGAEPSRVFNGMSCLAAQLVAEFKDGPGGIYLERPDVTLDEYADDIFIEYVYDIHFAGDSLNPSDGMLILFVYDIYGSLIFSGGLQNFLKGVEDGSIAEKQEEVYEEGRARYKAREAENEAAGV